MSLFFYVITMLYSRISGCSWLLSLLECGAVREMRLWRWVSSTDGGCSASLFMFM